MVGSRGPVEINPRDLMAREASVTGVALGMNCLELPGLEVSGLEVSVVDCLV